MIIIIKIIKIKVLRVLIGGSKKFYFLCLKFWDFLIKKKKFWNGV